MISLPGRVLFEYMVIRGGSVEVHEQEIWKAGDVRELIDLGWVVATTEGVVLPRVRLELKLTPGEIEVFKKIFLDRGVMISEARGVARLSRMRTWVEAGLVRTSRRDGVAYLVKT